MIMKKRYWFVVVYINSNYYTGKANCGLVTTDEKVFSNKLIKDEFIKENKNINLNDIVVESFIEFKNETEYINFWSK